MPIQETIWKQVEGGIDAIKIKKKMRAGQLKYNKLLVDGVVCETLYKRKLAVVQMDQEEQWTQPKEETQGRKEEVGQGKVGLTR